MNEQSPVNFFTINGNKGNVPGYNMFDNSTGQITSNNMMEQNIAPSVKAQSLTDELEQQGIKVSSPMAQESKQAFVDSLTTEQYNKMLQYKDAGYTFEASKAMLEQTMGPQGGGYRGEGFQINQPVGGTFLNSLNPVGLFFEKIDDWVQEHVTDFDDGDDESFSAWTAIKNVPGSFLRTASATARGLTNPLDTIVMLKDLAMTEEGRGILKERYGSWDGILNTLEKDPVGLISDVLAIVDGGASIVGGAAKAGALGAKVAGKGAMASKLTNFGNKASRLGNIAGVSSDLGLSIPYNAGLDAIGGKLSQGGKLARGAGTYLEITQRPLQTIWKGGSVNPEGITPLPGLSKKVGELINKAKENIQTTATGLTPELKDRIRNNPYVGEYWTKTEEMINSEGAPMDNMKITEQPLQELGEDLARRIEEYQARLEENGPAYRALRSTTKEFDLEGMKTSALGVFNRRDINVNPDGSLRFANMILPTDMNPINTAWMLIQNANLSKMTAKDYLNLRKQFDDLAKYESGTTSRGVKVIREMRNQMDKVAKKEIPGLAKIDELYSKQIKDLNEVKKGLVYMQGERKGELRDNFYSILRTLNTQNRQKMKARLENLIYPGIGARVEAIRMLPELAKAYQNSPQMLKAIFKTSGALAGIGSGKGALRTAMGYLVGLVADELLAKPLGEKRRKVAIDKLLSETTPEAQQMLAEVASKMKAGAELTENERISLETAIQEIVNAEDEYLNEQNLARWEKEWSKGRLKNPALPEARYEVGENGPKVNEPKAPREYNLNYENKAKEVLNLEEELNIDRDTATKVSDSIEDFLDEIGANEKGDLNPSEVNYDRFRNESLNELYVSGLPEVEKEKIARVLEERQAEESNTLAEDDRYYAYKIRQLEEEEQRIGKVGKNKVNKEYQDQQKRAHETKKEKVIKEIEQVYNLDANGAYDKYQEFANKPVEYIDSYKKSDRFADEEAERIVLERLMEQWSEQPKFTRNMSSEQLQQRNEFIDNVETKNGYKLETRDTNDRYVKEENGKIVDYGAIYWDDGKVRINAKDINGLLESGVLDHLPADGEIKISGEDMTMTVGEARGEQYQKFGKANPDEKWISADEGLSMRNFKNGKTVQDFMDHYGISRDIVEKIVTDKGERALGKYMDKMIELEKTIKEGTAPHELFHAVFDLVDEGRKERILNILMERNGWSRRDANEWLADNFSEYFRTGKFDNKEVPKGLKGKIRYFFNMIKDFVRGITREKKQVKQLFDDILDNKIEVRIEQDMVSEVLNTKNGTPTNSKSVAGAPSTRSLTIDSTNASHYLSKFDEVKSKIDSGEVTPENFLDTIKELLRNNGKESEYITNTNAGDTYTLRVSDHHARAWHSLIAGHPDNNTSLVFKLFSQKKGGPNMHRDEFKRNKKVDMKEFAYNLETITPEKMKGVIDGINEWITSGEFSDKNYDKFKESVKSEADYQIAQESLFDEPKKTFTEEEMKRAFDEERPKIDSVIERIATNQNRNADYPPYRIFLSILEGYSPDIQEWMKNIHKDIELSIRKSIEVREVIGLYHGLEQFLSSPEIKAWVEDNFKKNGHFGKELYDVMKRMEKEPLQIPEMYQNEKELGPLRNYLYDLEGINMSALAGTYDADPIEWKQNINKALLDKASRSLTLSKIYNIKNLLQDYIKNTGDKPVIGTFDDEGIQSLVDLEKEGMKQKISTYDKKQIQKIGYELNSALSPRITDVSKYIKSIDSDVYESEFVPQVLYTIGKTYNPDIEVWQQNLKEPIRELIDQYPKRKIPNADTKIISDDALNGLKAKINELEKYSIKDIQNAFEGQEAEVFMRAVKPQIDKLQAEGMNNAVRDLVALHNMELENFKKQIKKFDGKSPMPSIAVMDPNVPHEVFGDLTLVFGKGTVDPKNNPDNKLYGSDAWTPMFPDIKEVRKSGKKGVLALHQAFDDALLQKDFTDIMSEFGIPEGKGGIISSLAMDVNHYRTDLRNLSGKELEEKIDHLANKIAKINFKGYNLHRFGPEPINAKEYQWYEKNAVYNKIIDKIKEIYTEASRDTEYVIPAKYFNEPETLDEVIEKIYNEGVTDFEYYEKENLGENLKSFLKTIIEETQGEGPESVIEELHGLTNFDADNPKVQSLVRDFVYGTEDRPLTPENVLEAMKNQGVRREVEPGTFRDLIEIEGHKLNDIEDVRKQNFAKVFHGDRTGDLGDLEKRYYDILDIIMNEYIPYEEGRPLARLTMDAIKNSYDTDVKKFQENMNKEYKRKEEIPTDILQSIIDVVEQGKKVPIRFSESKPERVVDLYNEVRYILVPKGDVSKAKEIVKGTPLENKLVEYTPDNHSAPRARKLKELQKQYGNVFFTMGGSIMPIAMLQLMAEQIGGDNEEVA